MGAVIQYVMPNKFNFMKIMSKKTNGENDILFLQYTVSHRGINRWNLYRRPKITLDTSDIDVWIQFTIKVANYTIDKLMK